MDKSFNEQELSDIMKEIEELEQEFSGEDTIDRIEASTLMEELAEMHPEKSIPIAAAHENIVSITPKAAPKTQAPAAHKGAQSSMTFKVQGEMNLELAFEIGGKTIHLDVTEAGLTIQMEGGMTFSVPVSDAHSVKKAV